MRIIFFLICKPHCHYALADTPDTIISVFICTMLGIFRYDTVRIQKARWASAKTHHAFFRFCVSFSLSHSKCVLFINILYQRYTLKAILILWVLYGYFADFDGEIAWPPITWPSGVARNLITFVIRCRFSKIWLNGNNAGFMYWVSLKVC